VSRPDRITIPAPALAAAAARDSAREFAAAGSDIRSILRLDAIPWLVVTYDALRELPLDPRAGFVASLVDGRCTVEVLLDISGMPEDETLEILRELVRLGAVEMRDAK
jgi:hypothetical protein